MTSYSYAAHEHVWGWTTAGSDTTPVIPPPWASCDICGLVYATAYTGQKAVKLATEKC